ncbi:MAG: metallophosphoesterase [Pseudomonadota bacterium]
MKKTWISAFCLMILMITATVWAVPEDVTVTQVPTPTTCTATLDGKLLLHIPYLSSVDPISGTQTFWADLVYEFNPLCPTLTPFKLVRYGSLNDPSFSCAFPTLFGEWNIHIPDVLLPDGITHLWVDLSYIAALSKDGNAVFVVTNYGVVSNPWSFVVMGDSRANQENDPNGYNTAVINPMAADIANLSPRPKAVVVVGDLVNGDDNGSRTSLTPDMLGMLNNWKSGMAPVYNAKIPVYVIRGNHETYTGLWYNGVNNDMTDWMTAFGNSLPQNGPSSELGRTYYVMLNNSLFLCLDEYIQGNIQEPVVNQTWINTVLSGLNGKFSHLFVFGHVPARQVNANTVLSTNLPMRDAFFTSIINAGCTSYFCGHDHFYVLSELDLPNGSKLYQHLVGASGATDPTGNPGQWNSVYKNTNNDPVVPITKQNFTSFGYAVVTVNGSSVTQVWRAMDTATSTFSEWPNSIISLDSFASNLTPE